jgi:predicted enzyme related to lactoylglutathione lyase
MGVGDGPEDSYVIFHKKGTSLHGGIERVAPSDLVSPKSKQGSAVKITMTVEEVSKALEEIKKAGGEVVRYADDLLVFRFLISLIPRVG